MSNMSDAKLAWNLLTESVGDYQGRGVNHEKQNFTGKLNLKFEFQNKLLLLTSTATGDQGEIYHSEKSWIGFDMMGSLYLYVCSNNHPGIAPHLFNRIEKTDEDIQKIVFRLGDLNNKNSFREEVNINIKKDFIEHFYSWGLPGGEFEPRSGSRMMKSH